MKSVGRDAGSRILRIVCARSAAPMPLPAVDVVDRHRERRCRSRRGPAAPSAGRRARRGTPASHGMHTSPRAQRSMKLTASGVTQLAAMVRSPSFSRSSSSTTRTISPRRMRFRASSMVANGSSVTLLRGAARVEPVRSGAGQGDDHAAAVRLAPLGMDLAAVEVDDPLGDGEAEAGAAVAGCAGRVGAVEALEDAVDLVGSAMPGPSSMTSMVTPSRVRRARTCDRAAARASGAPRSRAGWRRPGGRARGRRRRRGRRPRPTSSIATLGRVQLLLAHRVLEQRLDRGTSCAVERHGAGLEPGEVEELLDQPAEPLDLGEHRAERLGVGGRSTPSTRFSSTACSAVIGVRSSWVTLATRSRRTRSVSASSAAIWLNARASSPTSSRDDRGDPPVVVALGHRRRGRGHLAQRRRHAAREEPRPSPARRSPARMPLTDGHSADLRADPEHEDGDRDRGRRSRSRA